MKKTFKKIGRWIVDIFLTLFGIVIAIFSLKFLCYLGMIGVGLFNMIFGLGSKELYLYDFEIQAMKDNHTYVVSRYSGESSLEYHFIREMDGRIHEGHTDASDSSIIEDGENKVDVYVEVPRVGSGLFMKLQDWASFDGQILIQKEYVYHVPKGSVERDFNVDLE